MVAPNGNRRSDGGARSRHPASRPDRPTLAGSGQGRTVVGLACATVESRTAGQVLRSGSGPVENATTSPPTGESSGSAKDAGGAMPLAISGHPWNSPRMKPFRRIRDYFRRPVGIPLGIHVPVDPAEHASGFLSCSRLPATQDLEPVLPAPIREPIARFIAFRKRVHQV